MKIDGHPYRSLWRDPHGLFAIDQTRLPHDFVVAELRDMAAVAQAIRVMVVRGAPLIGVTAAYGLALGLRDDASDAGLASASAVLAATRPTAVNLRWALGQVTAAVQGLAPADRADAALACADALAEADVRTNAAIGEHGAALLRQRWLALGQPDRLEVLTHCNAGWLACIDWGTALAVIYRAFDDGLPLHVWADETRPRNQGASLTTWELMRHGVPCTLIADNAGGHLMRAGRVHACIVGADRVSAGGDVCNKIGTYLKALAAADNQLPFYAALPLSTVDWHWHDGAFWTGEVADATTGATTGAVVARASDHAGIEVEERSPLEVTQVWGRADDGRLACVRIAPDGARAANPAFDVTPARLVTGLITEHGVSEASVAGLARWRRHAG
ncbi:MAG: S-methyl-5-thioribose-phosphate isomerase [Pseudomonadota bacterium]